MSSFLTLASMMFLLAAVVVVWPLWRADVRAAEPVSALRGREPHRWLGIWLVTAVLGVAVWLYVVLGSPQGIEVSVPSAVAEQEALSADATSDATPHDAGTPTGVPAAPQVEAMVQRLATRLQAQPNDPAGWQMLAKSYETLGRFDQAVLAHRNLMRLRKPDADTLSNYAVALGMSQGQRLGGEPEAALNEALKLDPRHPQALGLAADAADEREEHRLAMSRWRQLLAVLPASDPLRAQVQGRIDKAQALLSRDEAHAKQRRKP